MREYGMNSLEGLDNAAPPTAGLVCSYSMVDYDGTVLLDDSGNENHGYFYGGTVIEESPVGRCLSLSGSTSQGCKTSVLRGLATGFTISVFVNVTWRNDQYDSVFIADTLSGVARFRVFNYALSGQGLSFYSGSTELNATADILPYGWTHVLAQYEYATGLSKLFFNNVLIDSLTALAENPIPDVDMYIGKVPSDYSTDQNETITGKLCKFKAYNRVLNEHERFCLYSEVLW